MKLFTEEQVLDPGFRATVIKSLNDEKNKARKREALKRHDIFKDNTVRWVVEKLQNEGLLEETIRLMQHRASNISICRKVVEKLARSYNAGVIRDAGDEVRNAQVSDLAEMLDMDQRQKKADKYRQLFKNCFIQIVPEAVMRMGEKDLFRLKMKVLGPWQYDVLEDAKDPEVPAALILSDFHDTSSNDKTESYIWWTTSYHFTTDNNGKIIDSTSPEDLKNPINMLPGASVSEDQDGNYWATGGEDLTEGSVLVNTLITDMFCIAYMQGWGQMVITGKNIPESFSVGPHRAMILRYDQAKDEPKPDVQIVNANPPLEAWMRSIEQYVALLLSTNNLSPSNVSMSLQPGQYPSGIAMLVEKSEATGSIESAQKQFYSAEQIEWEVIKRWQNVFAQSSSLIPDFANIGSIPDDLRVAIKFATGTNEVVTEGERLENIKRRKELGLNTEAELIMMDNPGMSEEQATEKLLKIKAEKLENAHKQATEIIQPIEQQADEVRVNVDQESVV